MIPEDDFNPDAHPPIDRTRCLALGWHDRDPMPAVCARTPHDDGEHIANVFGGNVRVAGPLVTWETNETMERVA